MFKNINGEQDWLNLEYEFNGHYPVAILINENGEIDTDFAGPKYDGYRYDGHVLFVVNTKNNWPYYDRFKKAVSNFKHRNDMVEVCCSICGTVIYEGERQHAPNHSPFCSECE